MGSLARIMMRRLSFVTGMMLAVQAMPAHGEIAGVEILRTAHGVAHVTANDYRKLGFGIGYAYTSDNACLLAEQIVTASGERSLYFGAEGKALLGVETFSNLTSDIFHRGYFDDAALAAAHRKTSARTQALLKGFVEGYNHYLRGTGRENAGTSCRNAPWVRQMTMRDMYRMIESTALLASGAALAEGFAEAGRSAPTEKVAAQTMPGDFGLGSNGMAFGGEATANGRGLVIANPHFPWHGINRFYQIHATIPGKIDVMGVMLPPVPVVAMGFTNDVAWTHTVSTAARFTLSELTLAPGKPGAYLVDGKAHRLKARAIEVPTRAANGQIVPHRHVVQESLFGPLVSLPQAGLGRSETRAYAIQDANRLNVDMVEAWLQIAESGSVEALKPVLADKRGIPWVNTIAADRGGKALYADIGRVPNVDAGMQARCRPSEAAAALAPKLQVLRGDTLACRWSGFLSADRMRASIRSDYVSNSNDSYWLVHAEDRLQPLDPILGPSAIPQRFRTREALTQIDLALKSGKRFDQKAGFDLILSNRNYSGLLLADDVVRMCGLPSIPTDLAEACRVIAAWDRHSNLDSRGALLFREFWNRARLVPDVFAVAFDPADPLHTPRTLAIDNPDVQKALVKALQDAVAAMAALDLAPNASIREGQRISLNGAFHPVSGGDWHDGVLNLNLTRPVKGTGYEPFDGASYIAAIGFEDTGPVAEAILVYGQSSDPGSRWYYDQIDLYAENGRYRLPFSRKAIESDAGFHRQTIPSGK